MNLAFPLCCEPRHEDQVRDALGACIGFLLERLSPPALVAVVLTGSFARGEGSVLPVRGGLRVLGDLEFFVVLTDARGRLHRAMAGWGAEAGRRLRALGVQAEVEFGPIDLRFLRRRARPSIFVYDLRQHGKVLWGRRDVLQEIPAFAAEEIPREDALRLVFNRSIEQLEAYDALDRPPGERLLDTAYRQLKLTLDLAGSALAFAGLHSPLYRRRPSAFARLVAETPSLAARLPADFGRALADSARAKAEPAASLPWPPPRPLAEERERLRAHIAGAAAVVAGFLAWELERLLGLTGDLAGLLDAYLARPSAARRLRDWAKFAVNPLPAPLPVSHLRAARLALRSTPRALLDVAGARAYLALSRSPGTPAALDALLPLAGRHRPRDAAAQRQAVVALWRWGVRNR